MCDRVGGDVAGSVEHGEPRPRVQGLRAQAAEEDQEPDDAQPARVGRVERGTEVDGAQGDRATFLTTENARLLGVSRCFASSTLRGSGATWSRDGRPA